MLSYGQQLTAEAKKPTLNQSDMSGCVEHIDKGNHAGDKGNQAGDGENAVQPNQFLLLHLELLLTQSTVTYLDDFIH